MRRTLLFCAAIAFAIACGDNATEPVLDRTQSTPPVSFATSTSEDGLSITTDKDDYAPGDTVHFTGSGWSANDVLDIVLVDDAATQETHTWTISVAEDGTFQDSTYVVDVNDLGVTFTLTATSRANGRSLTVVFTDGNFTFSSSPSGILTSVTYDRFNGSGTCSGAPNTTNQVWTTGNIGLNTNQSIRFTVPSVTGYAFTGYSSGGATISPSSSAGTTVYCLSGNAPGTPLTTITLNYSAVPTGPTKLAFTSGAFTGVVGQCLGAITFETQNASNVATNVTSNTTVSLGTDGTGAFYSDNACATSPITSVSILTGNNSASFSYKATARGDGTHLVTISATGLTPASQTETINQAATSTTLTPSSNPSVFGELVTFEATVAVTAPGSGTPTGSVTFIEGGTCASPTTTLASAVVLSSSKASFQTSLLSVGSHTIVGCYSGDNDFTSSNGSINQTVDKASTSTSITSTSPSGSQYVNGPVTVNFSVTVQAPGSGTPIGTVEVKDGTTLLCSATLPATSCEFTPSAVAVLSLVASYGGDGNFYGSSSTAVTYTVKYRFDGLYAPVDRPNTMNLSKAGQAIPLKWRLTDYADAPILNLASVTVRVSSIGCSLGTTTDQLEEYAPGSSGLQNLGDGYYQFNWKTPTSYASSCKTISLEFVSGTPSYSEGPLAYFTFKK
jgi:hypothetical protein